MIIDQDGNDFKISYKSGDVIGLVVDKSQWEKAMDVAKTIVRLINKGYDVEEKDESSRMAS